MYKAEHTLAEMENIAGGNLIATIETDNNIACIYTGYKKGDDWYDEEIDEDGDFFMDICNKDYIRISTVQFHKPETDKELEMTATKIFEQEVA